jgi:hypothetical protein
VPQLTRLAFALLVSTLAACGGKSHTSPDVDGVGGTNAGGTGNGSSGTGNGSSGTGAGGKGHAGSAGTGTGGADVCASFDDDSAGAVNVAISNLTKATIYLGQDMVTCGGVSPPFQVADASGAILPEVGSCRAACNTVRTAGVAGCPAICLFPTSVALQPNEVLYTTWSGLFRVQGQLPVKCVPYETGSETMVACDQAKRIEPGAFTFSARAGSAVDCSPTTGPDNCGVCTQSPNGGCATPGSLVTGPMHTTQTFVVLNESYGVYPAASTNPGPNAGNAELPAPGDPIARLAVELIFTE